VRVENLTGHKLPTAYPSRRAWLHVVLTAADGRIVFESGKLNADGSIAGNANDADPTRFSPHYPASPRPIRSRSSSPSSATARATSPQACSPPTQYLKDNRILPAGFDKKTASARHCGSWRSCCRSRLYRRLQHHALRHRHGGTVGPLPTDLSSFVYQPVGYRWAHNLASYQAAEPQRFVQYYEQAAAHSALVLAHAETTVNAAP
jgi:hypothetical protein